MSTASSRPAPTRGPGTGWSPCPGRTGRTTRWPTWRRPASWPRAAAVWRGASPIPTDDRCLGSISLEGLGGYAPRGEIGYWAHPDARGRGVITEAVRLVTAYAEGSGLAASTR